MSCGCKRTDSDAERRYAEVLERGGLREIVEQGRNALEEGSSALGHLVRAERAEVLGFGHDVVRMHRDAATRSNRRAVQQLGFVVDRIDARRKAEDWPGIVKDAQAGFREHGGRERVDDAREELRIHLLDQDAGPSAPVAEQLLALFDQAAERASEGSLDAVLDLMREGAQFASDGFASEQMGRQPAAHASALFGSGPPRAAGGQNVNGWCVALAACEVWAWSSYFAALAICFAVPFCWCCFFPVISLALLGHHLTCLALFAGGCSSTAG